MNKLKYVKYIYEDRILIFCEDTGKKNFLTMLKAKRKLFDRNLWMLPYENRDDLAKKLQVLNDNNFMFLGSASGWNPADIYISMREENKVTGKIEEISWTNQKKIVMRTL